MAADGTLYIETAIDTDGFVAGGKDVEAAAKRMAKTVKGIGASAKIALKKQAESFVQMNQQYARQSQKVEELKNKLKELENVKVETKEYQKLGTELKELESQFEAVEQKQREWIQMGFPVDSGAFKELEKQLDEIWVSMEKIQTKQQQMKAGGSAYVNPKTSQKYQGTEARIAVEEQKLVNMNNKLGNSYEALKQKVADYGKKNTKLISISKRLQKAVSIVGTVIKGLGTTLKKVGSTLKSMVSSLKKAASAMTGFRKESNRARMSLGKMLGMSLLFSSVFRAISGVTNGIKEGMQNLAQYSDKTNASLSLLMSSLTRLKNSFATAFAPILSVVAPIMSSFIDMLSRGATYVGMFFAAITGQDSFIRAKSVQQDYAASLDKTSKSTNKAAKATKDAAKEAKGSLAPWDELNVIQMDLADSLEDTADVAAPEIGELTPQDMFEEVPIKSSVKNFADKLKKLIKAQDWNGIGKLLGQQINKGLKKLNKAIRWDNVGDDITKGVDAITGIFNALVDEIDWEYMGDTAGEGVNTLFKTLNQLMEKTDWKNLGKGFAEFANGLMDTVEWDEVGKFFGNKVMMLWDILNGAAHELNWEEVGVSIGEALNAAFAKISFSEISDTLATGINGAFKSLDGFTKTFEWDDFAQNVADGISDFLADMDWKENGKALGGFLSHLCAALKKSLTKDTFYDLGKGIGDFLGELPWLELLGTAAGLLIDGLGGALEGLWESGLAGKITAGLTAAFIAVKIADITGIGKLASWVIKSLAGKIAEKKSIETMTKAFKDVISESATSGASQAAEALKKTGETAGKVTGKGAGNLISDILVPAAGLSAAIIGVVELTSAAASLVETLQGGNGDLTETGAALHDLTGKLQNIHKLTSDQAEELWKMIEANESMDITAREMADSIMEQLGLYGISGNELKNVLESAEWQIGKTAESTELLAGYIDQLGEGVSKTAGIIDLSSVDIKDAFSGMRDVLLKLRDTNSEVNDNFSNLDYILGQQLAESTPSAQEAFDAIVTALEEANVPTDEFITLMKEKFPEAAQAVKTSVDTHITGAQEKISSTMKTAEADVAASTGNMKKDVDASFGAIDQKSKSTWDNSQKSVSGSLSTIDTDTKKIMGNVMTTVQSYWSSVLTNTNQIWERASKKVETELVKMVSDTDACTKSIADKFTSLKTAIENNLSGMYDIGHNAIIGLNNGMVDASDTLYRNARTIAQNIPDIFRDVLKIHSPSKIMGDLGDYTMEGYYYRLEAWLGKIQNLAHRLSDSMQSALQFDIPSINVPVTLNPSAGNIYPRQIPVMAQGSVVPPQTVRYSDNKNSSSAADDVEGIIKRVLASVQENTGNVDVIQAFRDAMSGMAVYADDKIIGYLQEKNQEECNRSGSGLF